MPEDLVYAVTKAVLENNPSMVKGHAASKETLIENWNRNTFLPFHPGAMRYLQGKRHRPAEEPRAVRARHPPSNEPTNDSGGRGPFGYHDF